MTKIFEHANEQHVRAGVVYFNSVDGIVYTNSAKTEGKEVTKDELINLFNKGILVVDTGSAFVRPTTLTVSDNFATASYTTVGASDIAVETKFYSKGYVAG